MEFHIYFIQCKPTLVVPTGFQLELQPSHYTFSLEKMGFFFFQKEQKICSLWEN